MQEGTAFFPGSSLAGNGLLVSDGDTWRRQRRLSNPAFRDSAVAGYARAMVHSSAQLVGGAWARRAVDGATTDVYADFNELTFDITLDTLFGQRTRSTSQVLCPDYPPLLPQNVAI